MAGGHDGRLPIGVSLGTIRADAGWWLESARRLDAAGYAGRLGLGPLHGPGRPDRPGRRAAGRSLSMAAGATSRIGARVVRANVMNRHPAVRRADGLDAPDRQRRPADRSASGSAGTPKEHAAYGIDFPDAAGARRAARGGRRGHPGAVDRRPGDAAESPFYPLDEAYALPVPDPAPRILIGGEIAGGRAARGPHRRRLDRVRVDVRDDLPLYLEALEAAGSDARTRPSRRVPGRVAGGREPSRDSPVGRREPRETWARWADGRRRRGDRHRPHDERHRRRWWSRRPPVGAWDRR